MLILNIFRSVNNVFGVGWLKFQERGAKQTLPKCIQNRAKNKEVKNVLKNKTTS